MTAITSKIVSRATFSYLRSSFSQAVHSRASLYLGAIFIPSGLDFLCQKIFKKYMGPQTSMIPSVLSIWCFSRLLSKNDTYLILTIYLAIKKTFINPEKRNDPPNFRFNNLPRFNPPPPNFSSLRPVVPPNLQQIHIPPFQAFSQLCTSLQPLSIPSPHLSLQIADDLRRAEAERLQALQAQAERLQSIMAGLHPIGEAPADVQDSERECPTFTAWNRLAQIMGVNVPGLNPAMSRQEKEEKAREFITWLETKEITELLGQIETFDFSGTSHCINSFPHLSLVLSKLKNVKKLNLSSNLLSKLPSEVFQLKTLEVLKINGNCLETLPDEIVQLSNLKELKVKNNRIRSLPPKIHLLTNLQILFLDTNLLEKASIAQTCFPPNLVRLSLSNNTKLEALPENISQLRKLEDLDVGECGLETLPISFSRLEHLEKLCVADNQIAGFSSEFRFPSSLKSCNLSGNQLPELPYALYDLPLITALNIGGNPLITLHKDLARLQTLKALNLAGSQLSDMPPVIFTLANLEILDLSTNQLTILPGEIAKLNNLKILLIYSNRLTFLPPEISQLPHLEEFAIEENRLTDLPENYQYLSSNCTIYADNNRFTRERALQLGQIFRLRQITNPEQGPEFRYAVDDSDNSDQHENTIEAEIQSWLALAGQVKESSYYQKLLQYEYRDYLCTFLNRLKQTQDFKNGGNSKTNIISRAVHMLNQAAVDEKFCKAMFGVIQGALATCSQRIENSFDDIEVEWHISQAERITDLDLAKVLIGKRRRILLRDIAEQIAKKTGQGDHLAVVQFYQVKLKTRLELPISTMDLSYSSMVHATESELAYAVDQVLNETSTQQQIYQILLQESRWKKKLEEKYTVDIEIITENMRSQLDEIKDHKELSDQDKVIKLNSLEKERQKQITEFFAQKTLQWIQLNLSK